MSSLAEPRIWVLTGERAGDRAQALALAALTDRVFVEKQLRFNGLYKIPNVFLGGTRLTLTAASKASLTPPWPDLVIAVGRRTAPIARWIWRQSGKRARLVHVGRPWAPLHWFDLIVTTPQYSLPALPHVVEVPLPLGKPAGAKGLETAAPKEWDNGPILGLLVGGPSQPYRFGAEEAARLTKDAIALAGQQNATIVAITSPRTPIEAHDVIKEALRSQDFFCPWRPDAATPYQTLLNRADLLLVTQESASMTADAIMAQKPVILWPLPEDPSQSWPWRRWLKRLNRNRHSGNPGWVTRFYDFLVIQGLGRWPRDLSYVHHAIIQAGLAEMWEPEMAWLTHTHPDNLSKILDVKERIKQFCPDD